MTGCVSRAAEVENLFLSCAWTGAIEATYGFDFHRAGDEGGAEVFAFLDDAMGARMVSPAFGDYAEREPGPGLDRRVRRAREAFPRAPYTVKVAGICDLPEGRKSRDALLHEVSLPGYEMRSSFDRNVRKARRAGLSVRRRTDRAALSEFYELYCAQRLSKFGALPQPLPFFEAVADAFFPHDGFLLEAGTEGRSAAFLIVLRHGDVLYYKFGASDPGALSLRPNNLLMAHLLELAVEEGATRLDLGLSPAEGGLARFKRDMGARELPLASYRWPPLDGPDPDGAGVKAILSEVTGRLVARDPDAKTASAMSAALYRYFA